MKALSMRQPWAELILQGKKTIETRSWRTAHRGIFVIHTAWHVETAIAELYGIKAESLVSGALVGAAEIVEMIEFDEETWLALRSEHLVPDDNANGRAGWRLANARRFTTPILYRGLPGLFPLDTEAIEQITYE